MSTVDSNKENKVTDLKPAPPVQQAKAVAPAPAAAPKSYTERFIDMENTIQRMAYVINFHAKTIEGLLTQINEMGEELERQNMVRKSVNAIMKLSEEGQTVFSLEKVAEKVGELENKAAKDQLAQDLKDGVVKPADTIENDLTVFEFESLPEGNYGLASVGMLNAEVRKELLGKKAGDTVKNLKITAIYAYVGEKQPEAAPEGKDEKTAATTEG